MIRMYKFIKLIIALFFITNAYSAIPNNLTVTNLSDDGSVGSLRWAISSANADIDINQIDFTLGLTGIITLTSDLPVITRNLTIVGPGVLDLTLSGNNLYKMFIVNNGSALTISGITFKANASFSGSIFRANSNNSSIVANSISVTANTKSYAFYTNSDSTITITDANFTNNSSNLFGSDYGSAPTTTSTIETDYTNRITVTGSTFDANTGTIFSTERYVKIDNCIFSNNTSQIGSFRGVNRYQVLNSTFTNNTGSTLFSFSSWIGQASHFGESTLSTNNTLFDGNTFTGNTGTVINPGSNVYYYNKTTISNNVFTNNGTSYTGSPAVVTDNTLDNFITSITHSVLESTLTVGMSRPVFNTNIGNGAIEASDIELFIVGGNATLVSSTPTSISANGNIYTIGIELFGEISGAEMITVKPASNSIYDDSFNLAGVDQQKNTINLNFLDDDADGVSNFLDLCPNTSAGVRIYPYNGCEDTTYPFITYLNYGSTLKYPSNFVSTADHTLYFLSYDINWQESISKLTPEKVISTLFTPINGYVQSLTIDASNNLYFVYRNNDTSSYEIRKITPDGITSVLLTTSDGPLQNLTTDTLGNVYVVLHINSSNSRELKKIAIDGTVTLLSSDTVGRFQNLIEDNLGTIYFVNDNYSTNSRIIKKIAADGSITELYSTNDYIENLKIDTLGNLYFRNYSPATNSYELKKLISTGIISNLYVYGSNVYPQSIAIDAMNNLFFVFYDYNTRQQQINSITPEGIIVSYGEFMGDDLFNDRDGSIYFNDDVNQKIMGTKALQLTAILSNFNDITKYYFDGSFTIVLPNSDSTGAFTFVSSNTDVATISGTTVTIVGAGVTTITATQASDATYLINSISANLTVNSVSILTTSGGVSGTDLKYVNQYGQISGDFGLSANGAVLEVKTPLSFPFPTIISTTTGKTWMDRNLGATQVATSSTDVAAYGDLYQWGRGTDGHQLRTSTTTATLSSSATSGHGDFITAATTYDWLSTQDDSLWNGLSGINNPCPSGFRLPTNAEFEAEALSSSSDAYEKLKMPSGGFFEATHSIFDVGSDGYYWTSGIDLEPTTHRGYYLWFSSSNSSIISGEGNAAGMCVRCIKD
jgi:hypothetical protein